MPRKKDAFRFTSPVLFAKIYLSQAAPAKAAKLFIEKMRVLSGRADGELKQEIEKQVKLAAYGLAGERNIAFELRNSGMDMLILHDLYFEHKGKQAQIDYLVVTRRRIYIIECKNLIGNIEIDSSGSFIRTYELFGKPVKEGLYSPITQNERHRLVIREMREQEESILKKLFFGKSSESTYQAVVVLANPKTYLNARFAKKEVKDQVIRADQLINYIREHDGAVNTSYSDDPAALRSGLSPGCEYLLTGSRNSCLSLFLQIFRIAAPWELAASSESAEPASPVHTKPADALIVRACFSVRATRFFPSIS